MAIKANSNKSSKTNIGNQQKISSIKPTNINISKGVSSIKSSALKSSVVRVSKSTPKSTVIRINRDVQKKQVSSSLRAPAISSQSKPRTPSRTTIKPLWSPNIVMNSLKPKIMKGMKRAVFKERISGGSAFERKVNLQLKKQSNSLIGSQINAVANRNVRVDNILSQTRGKGPLRAISVKDTRWHQVLDTTWKKYVREAAGYKKGIITTAKPDFTGFRGNTINGRPILVLPKKYASQSSANRLRQIKDYANTIYRDGNSIGGISVQLR